MTKKNRAKQVVELLREKFKEPKIALNYENEYQLLVAVILSAQCTDVRVNIVTKDFFKIIKTIKQANSTIYCNYCLFQFL